VVQHAWDRVAGRARHSAWVPIGERVLAGLTVFTLVNVAWVFFRSPDFSTAFAYLAGIAALTPGAEGALIPVLALMAYTLAIDVPQAIADDEYVFLNWPVGRRALATAAASLLLLGSGTRDAPFIYFQF
jgi:hypothetical protein